MKIVKRVFRFVATNILIIATLSIVMSLLGIQPYLNSKGINYQSLLIFCLIWGFGGAFISFGLSRSMSKWMMGVKVIDPQTTHPDLDDRIQNLKVNRHQFRSPRGWQVRYV